MKNEKNVKKMNVKMKNGVDLSYNLIALGLGKFSDDK